MVAALTLSLLDVGPTPVETTALAPSRTDADTVAVPVLTDEDGLVLGPGAAELEEDLGTDLLGLLEAVEADGAAGEVTRVPADGRQVYVVGVGAGAPDDLRKAGAALARRTRGRTAVATSVPAVGDRDHLVQFVSGFLLGGFEFSLRRDPDPADAPAGRLLLALEEGAAGLDEAVAIGTASWRARWLSSVPSNVKNPPWLADQAVELASQAGLEAKVWDETDLAKDGFGGILAVGQGSATPPRLVQLDYTPDGASRKTPRIVLVGKGITFDTGGLNLKPGDSMVNMRRDMTGAAVVASVLAALPALGCPVRVTGLLACAENAVSGTSMRPSDVITHYGGLTSEVNNTDAEGRLVMADALAYAADRLDPALLVDVATLTGAVKVALGQTIGGFFATSDELADLVAAAGDAAAEPVWRLPLAEDLYGEYVEGTVADLDNAPNKVGTIAAALFLKAFTGDRPWVHLDIASVGEGADRDEWTKGPTGFGARLLLHWLGSAEPLKGVS